MSFQPQINYKNLRNINPEAARTAVLEYLASNGGNIAETARVFGIQRLTVYDILKRHRLGYLKDKSRAPKKVANKTPMEIEKRILRVQRRTGFGAKRLQKLLSKRYKIEIAYGTIRGILRRNSKILNKNYFFSVSG